MTDAPPSPNLPQSEGATATDPDATLPPFLSGGGDCADRIARIDWSETMLGPVEAWPKSLTMSLAMALRSAVPFLLLWGEDGVMLYNDAYAAFVGDGHPALLGTKVSDGWPEHLAFNEHIMAVGLDGGTLHFPDLPVPLRRAGQEMRAWVNIDTSPITDIQGKPVGVLCILAETTERVLAERRAAFLLTLSDHLRALETPAEIMALAAERLGEELSASRVFYAEITTRGWMTVERDYARGVSSIVGRHSLESFGPDLLAAYRGGAPVVVTNVGADERLSDGARSGLQAREVGAFVDVVLFEEEEWVGLLAVQSATPRTWSSEEEALVQNVGERVKVAVERCRAELALRQLKDTLEQQVVERTAEIRRYHEIVEAIASPICAFDTDYCLIAFNKAHDAEFRRIYGFPSRIGDVFHELFVPEQRGTMRALMSRALTGEHFTVTEAFGSPELGIPIWEITYTPLRNGAGQVVAAFHQATDISERLRAAAELEAAQEALRQSQKVEAMGSLTGGVAHDFNNLLTPIIGSLDMLMRKGSGTAREKRLIDGALQSAERAKTLVQRLLAFARRQPLQPTAVDLGSLVDSMTDLIGSTVGPTIALEVDIADNLPPAKADANQVEMALLNLSVNARDAMPNGGRLCIKVRPCRIASQQFADVPAGDCICLSVSDTGMGMDEATRQRAIEPFFSTKGVGKGTGLGLSMVHGLAAQLGGGLTIRSELGQGTEITLWLPVSDVEAATPTPAAPAPANTDGVGTVLLVDDEDLVRMSTADMLADMGYGVVEAMSGAQALELVQAGLRPDLLVTDHLMPGMNGAQLVRELEIKLPELRSLIVSGYAEAEGLDIEIARLTKPFRSEELAASLTAIGARASAAPTFGNRAAPEEGDAAQPVNA
ncbi:PAS domain-containing protein [Sphingomonas sanguinis]|uniref:histidine kinase n=1 Tax=Sphingomonas sanguinis TaxID=33051 RepID=A0ABU5LKK2_9SPHN|nr:ATP-binding protein [Sphingomonas sanguinis]MDZ7280456.1 PAS domain-containing protein [Sphingomonas sanguinis]